MPATGLRIGDPFVLCWMLLLGACKEAHEKPLAPGRAAGPITSQAASAVAKAAEAPSRPSGYKTEALPTSEPSGGAALRHPKGTGAFLIDEPTEVAPAGPASAHELGVVMVTKQDRVLVARREPRPSAESQPTALSQAKTKISQLERPRDDFATHGRGPFVSSSHAHWVSQGRLVRRRLDGSGELDVLARDARSGTRVAGSAVPGAPIVLAYVTMPDESGTPRAKLWVEGGKFHDLTADGSGTSSVALVAQTSGYLALALDGRSAMTPMHARKLTRKANQVVVENDVVIWVGASAQPTTEVFGAALGDDVWAFVPIEQDVLRFGLAQIHVGSEPRVDAPARFTTYLNGLNSAPMAAAALCGNLALVYAAPVSKEPRARAELVLGRLLPEETDPGETVARARSFSDVSLAAVPGGGLLVYTADQRTWAVDLRCRDGSSAPKDVTR